MSDLKLQKRFLTPFLLKNVPPVPVDDSERLMFPKKLNIISKTLFWWLHPIMRVGYKRTLVAQDMYYLNDDVKVEAMAQRFIEVFENLMQKAREKHLLIKCKQRNETRETSTVDEDTDLEDFQPPKYIVAFALLRTFAYQYLLACLCLVLANVGSTTTPLLSKKLIAYVELKALGVQVSVGDGVGYALGCSFLVIVVGIFFNHTFYNSMLTGAQAKAVLTKAVLDKSFRLSAKSRHKFPTAKITSIMGTDLARIDFALGFQPFLFTFPIPIGIAIGILCSNIGASAMVGIGFCFVFLVVMLLLTKKLFNYRRAANVFTDARVNYIKEVLGNLKMIKLYSWEIPYKEAITEKRNNEMSVVYRLQVARNAIMSVASSLTLFASLFSFLVLYATTKGTKNPASIFSSISLFNTLTQLIFMLPIALGSLTDALVGVVRAGELLGAEEVSSESSQIEASPEKKQLMDSDGLSVSVTDGSFEWETFDDEEEEDDVSATTEKNIDTSKSGEKLSPLVTEKDSLTDSGSSVDGIQFENLKGINLDIKKGEFIAITGVIGSGKTSLLNSLAGFMKRTSGELNVNGSILLCGTPWIQNATVKENITFGEEFDEEKYKNILYCCSLESDMKILPGGDQTEIGERGITLSGGQKARINLARAVYKDTDIILLDDVLSAVDARVGKHIMENCLLGILKDKTRILATHQLSLIGSVDRVIFLNGDGTIDVGTLEELKGRNPGFNHLMAFNSEAKKNEEDEDEDDFAENQDEKERLLLAKQISRHTAISSKVEEEEMHYDYVADIEIGKLIEAETSLENGIKFSVYKYYVKYGSGIFKHYSLVPLLIVLIVLAVFCQLFTNVWLSFWTGLQFPGKSDGFYIGFYVMFTVLAFLFLTAEFVLIAYMVNEAATMLHLKAVQKVLHVPMSFMDTTPMGRLLNRFTKDSDTLDNEIGNQIRMLLYFMSTIIGTLILCVVYLPWFAIAIPFLVLIFIAISSFYQGSAREIKRLEATQRSCVYNNFNETLSGMDSLKALKSEARFLAKNELLINKMNEAYYLTIANQRWLAIHLDMVATLLCILISLLCVFRVFLISASSVGLLLSYVLQIALLLSMSVRMYTQVENEMNSVERISEYAFDLPQEAPYVISETLPEPSWPQHGAIRFENLSMSYRPGLPLVLNNLNIDIKPSEKIGICGRTGAGKSSIMTALYRLSELSDGKIEIDGVDISTIGLNNLRSKLSIIPQDPVLFKGDIRKNLDPFGLSSDADLWNTLTRAGLIDRTALEAVQSQDSTAENIHKFHLDRKVEDEGSNFSLGERQLISFARALVRGTKILILDEATSSVDYETDSKIQETIVKEFSDCTILCIAHRLKTIINYDRIVVMDKGKIVELDTPWNLFNLTGSIFHQMCERSNITASDFAGH